MPSVAPGGPGPAAARAGAPFAVDNMSALSVNPSMTFAGLKELLQTTDGNLSIHARKLEDAGYVTCKKRFYARVPKTEFSLTAKGKRMFARHLEHMEALIHAAKGT